ncbi:MAG: HDIG domain-containing protein [Kiritimatiellia bacterium]
MKTSSPLVVRRSAAPGADSRADLAGGAGDLGGRAPPAPPLGGGSATTLVKGQLAPASILAEVDFDAEDPRRTQLARDAAAASVAPVFRVDPGLIRMRDMGRTFDEILTAHARIAAGMAPVEAATPLGKLLGELGIKLEPMQVLNAIPSNRVDAARTALDAAVAPLASRGIVSVTDRASLFGGKAAQGRVALLLPGTEGVVPRPLADLPTVDEVRMEAFRRMMNELPASSNLWMAFLRYVIEPTVRYEPELTRERIESARKAVEPVRVTNRRGSILVEAGERVSEATLEMLQAHSQAVDKSMDVMSSALGLVGKGMLLAAVLFALGGILVVLRSPMIGRPSRILMAGVVSALALVLANGLLILGKLTSFISVSMVQFTLPFALAPLLLAVLSPGVLAVAAGFWTSACLAVMLDYNLPILALGMVVTSIACLTGSNLQRRTSAIRSGLYIGAAQAVYAVCVGLLNQQEISTLPAQAGVAFASGVVISYLAIQFVPLFESAFRVTSDLRLLQLTDLSHPLLQRLSLEAPGTYHHSQMVANLAQAAAAEVGANELLVRVAAYFHDVGKLSKPDFFIENVPYRENPHDDLAPSMSTLVIISHVKEGLGLGLRHKLPQVVLDGIQQHHGTSLVSYFYHRALEQLKELPPDPRGAPAGVVDEEQFRYPGPKPQTVEMGILLLADTIEAASRSVQKPSPGNIERMVNELVEEKVRDGQLDDCGITLAQLAAVRRSFIFSLNNMLHPRIAYPRENRPDQPADTVSRRAGRSTETVRVPPAEG